MTTAAVHESEDASMGVHSFVNAACGGGALLFLRVFDSRPKTEVLCILLFFQVSVDLLFPSHLGQDLNTSYLPSVGFLAYISTSGISEVVRLSDVPVCTDLDLAVVASCALVPVTGSLAVVPPSDGEDIGRPMLGVLSRRVDPAMIPLANPDTADNAPEATVLPKPATFTANVPVRSCTDKLKCFQFSNCCLRRRSHCS